MLEILKVRVDGLPNDLKYVADSPEQAYEDAKRIVHNGLTIAMPNNTFIFYPPNQIVCICSEKSDLMGRIG